MLAILLLVLAGSVDLTIDYKMCVEKFAIDQVRSGESAETLIASGEANCVAEWTKVERAHQREFWDEIAKIPEAKTLSKADIQQLADDAIKSRNDGAKEQARAGALRNVVFFKARLNEMESD